MVKSSCSLPRAKELAINTTDIELQMEKLPWESSDLTSNLPGIMSTVRRGIMSTVRRDSGGRPVDMLATIFAGQHQLMETYEEIERRNGCVVVRPEYFGAVDDRQVQMRLKDLAYRVIEELSEATNTLKNKPWKQTFVATDVDHFQEEIADALHFFVEFLITAGMTAEDIFKMYFRKHAVNQFRQESKY